uniref:Uncharacterized protein n=1 Tax=Pongo abelii TaxID=9601 RepID=A0A8I5UHI9_PONAB
PHRQATASAPNWKRHSGDRRSQPALGPSPGSHLTASASGVLQHRPEVGRGGCQPPARARTHRLRQPHQPYSFCQVTATPRASETPRTLRIRNARADASLTPPEAGAASVTGHPSVALTTAGAVRVEKLQVLRGGEETLGAKSTRSWCLCQICTCRRHDCPHGTTRIYENSGAFCPTTEYLEKCPMYDSVLPPQSLKPKQEIRACRGKMEGITTFK